MPSKTDAKYSLCLPLELTEENVLRIRDDLHQILNVVPERVFIDCSRLVEATPGHVNLLWEIRSALCHTNIETELQGITDSLTHILKELDLYDRMLDPHCHNLQEDPADAKKVIYAAGTAFEYRFKPDVDHISDTIREFKKYLGKQGFRDSMILELETIFYEIATNIRLHSKIDMNSEIDLTVALQENLITIKFIYSGVAFDPTSDIREYNPTVAVKKRQRRGYGLIMINRMVDNITYRRTEDGLNELYIEKELGESHG